MAEERVEVSEESRVFVVHVSNLSLSAIYTLEGNPGEVMINSTNEGSVKMLIILEVF